ncbi:unnamed protein product [Ectocarpus fasciculatus]
MHESGDTSHTKEQECQPTRLSEQYRNRCPTQCVEVFLGCPCRTQSPLNKPKTVRANPYASCCRPSPSRHSRPYSVLSHHHHHHSFLPQLPLYLENKDNHKNTYIRASSRPSSITPRLPRARTTCCDSLSFTSLPPSTLNPRSVFDRSPLR